MSHGDTEIAGGTGTGIIYLMVSNAIVVIAKDIGCIVRRAIVNHDNLITGAAFPQSSVNCPANQTRAVISWDYYRNRKIIYYESPLNNSLNWCHK